MKKTFTLILLLLVISISASAQEEQPPRIESIEILGNDEVSGNLLKQVMLLRASSMFNTVRYNREIFMGDLDSIIQYYHRSGYLQAAISDTLMQALPENRVRLVITIAEGALTAIETVGFSGNNRFTSEELAAIISITPGDPYRQSDIDTATSQLLRFFADHGYLESEVNARVDVDDETHTAVVIFDISERDGFYIDSVRVEGLDKTKRGVVMREVDFGHGDMVNYSKLLNTQRELYLTGLFRSVYVRPVPPVSVLVDSIGGAQRDILIDLEENISGEFNVSVGYDTVERLRSRIELYNNNLRGSALKMGVTGLWSTIQNKIAASLTEPRLFNTRWQNDLNLYREYRQEPGYNTHLFGGMTTLGRRFSTNSRINFAYRYDGNRYTVVKLSDFPDKAAKTSSFKTSFVYDTRNNLFNSSKGFYFELTNEYGGFFVGNVRTFSRVTTIIKYFYPLSNVLVLGSAIEGGIIDSQGGLSRIPLSERFYAGGPNSIRGFAYRKVGPLDAREKPVGGSIKLVWNVLEIRRNLWRWLNGAMFYDMGNVWTNTADLNLRDIRHGAGVGLRISTPLGLARIDYGFKLDKRANEDRTELYFSMGQAF